MKKSNILDSFLKMLKAKGVEPTAEEVTTLAGELMTDEEIKKSNPSIDYDSISHNKEVIRQLTEQNQLLQDTIKKQNEEFANKFDLFTKAMQEEKESREKALLETRQELENKAKAEKELSINALIQKAIEDKKIVPQNEKLISEIKKIADMDIESAKVIIENQNSIESPSNGNPITNNNPKAQMTAEMQTLMSGISPAILERVNN